MKYLAIDYGLKHIGLATSTGILAEPYDQLINTGDKKVIAKIAKICLEQAIDEVIVGISEQRMAQLTQQFAKNLQNTIDVPLRLVDETLSSHTAQQYLIQGSAPLKKRQTKQHQTAAAVILQEYLDKKNDNIVGI